MQQTLCEYLQPFWHNLEKKKVKKKVVVNKSRSLAAMFVSENGMQHFTWSKIHPMNTMEGHLKHFKQTLWYLPNIGKVQNGLWRPSCFTNVAQNQQAAAMFV